MKMEVIDAINKRYAAKLFTGEKIPEEDFEKLKKAILMAPSWFNIQPWRIKIVRDKETLEKLQEASYGQPQVGTASELFVFCSIDNLDENKDKIIEKMKNANVPEDKIKGYLSMLEPFLTSSSKEASRQISKSELFLPAENLMLTATSLGYGSCPMGGFEKEKFKEILNLPEEYEPTVIVPVGYTADEARPKLRLDEEDVFF